MLFGRYINKYYLKYAIFFIIGVAALVLVDVAQLFIPEYLGEIVDTLTTAGGALTDEMKARLNKEIEALNNEIKRCQNMLNNPSFLAKAPAEKVSLEREKLQKHRENLKVLEEKIKNI